MRPSNLPTVKIICFISCCSSIALFLLPRLTYSFSLVLPYGILEDYSCTISLRQSHPLGGRFFLRNEAPSTGSFIERRKSVILYLSSGPNRRKRRRRKDTSGDDDTEDATDSGPELPDFDLNDNDGMESTTRIASSSSSSSPSAVDPLLGPITPNMMAATRSSVSSVNDLLRDRSLEQKLERLYDGAGSEPEEALPDLLSLQRKSTPENTAASLSKRERQVLARQQQDEEQQQLLQNAAKEEDLSALVSKLPFITNEQGKVVPTKILETATWACIIALILWEVYINSPFFNRAAPIIPVVYDIWI
jgi:hypothetical protein